MADGRDWQGFYCGAQSRTNFFAAVKVSFSQEHGKLLTADARSEVYTARSLLQDLGDVPQHLVPGIVALGVVNCLKVIDVQHDQTERPSVTKRALDLALQLTFKAAAIRQSCQMIGEG